MRVSSDLLLEELVLRKVTVGKVELDLTSHCVKIQIRVVRRRRLIANLAHLLDQLSRRFRVEGRHSDRAVTGC